MDRIERLWQLWTGAAAGGVIALAHEGLHQDSFGSLDGYCAYLKDGNWVDGRSMCIVGLVVGLAMLLGLTVKNLGSHTP